MPSPIKSHSKSQSSGESHKAKHAAVQAALNKLAEAQEDLADLNRRITRLTASEAGQRANDSPKLATTQNELAESNAATIPARQKVDAGKAEVAKLQ